ncbi:hypothetical protein D3C72_2019800 [compost metagenome]
MRLGIRSDYLLQLDHRLGRLRQSRIDSSRHSHGDRTAETWRLPVLRHVHRHIADVRMNLHEHIGLRRAARDIDLLYGKAAFSELYQKILRAEGNSLHKRTVHMRPRMIEREPVEHAPDLRIEIRMAVALPVIQHNESL